MIDGHRVVAWVPFGRERSVSILAEYLRREHERGVVDELWLFMNTNLQGQESDIAYAYRLAATHPDWVRILERAPDQPRRTPVQRNTTYGYRSMTDRDTVYVRLDDDIVYLQETKRGLARAPSGPRGPACLWAPMRTRARA